jgi:type IV pilus assembly protein PilC
LIFVIPQFEELFKGFGADLPAFTQMVVNYPASCSIKAGGWARRRRFYAFFYFYKRSRKMQLAISTGSCSNFRSSAPSWSKIGDRALRAHAVDHVRRRRAAGRGHAVGRRRHRQHRLRRGDVLRMKDEVATGQRLQRAMENTGLFPNMVVQMIAVGEESGSLDTMSGKVAEFYEAEVDNAVDSMSSLLEP